jgi:oligosaccharide repeat unit polymerase
MAPSEASSRLIMNARSEHKITLRDEWFIAAGNVQAATRIRTVLIIHSVLLLWVLVAFGACSTAEASFVLRSACFIFTGVSVWLTASWLWSGGQVLSPYCLFLLSALIFNGGQIWLYALDPTIALLSNEFSPEITLKTILLVSESVMFLHLGALLALRTKVFQGVHASELDEKSTSQSGWFLFCISVVPAAQSLYSAVRAVTLHGYMFLYQQDPAAGLAAAPQLIAVMLLPATFLIFSSNSHKPFIKLFCVCTLLICASTQLVVGTRAAAVTALVSFAWLWENCVGKIRSVLIIFAAGTAILLLPVIAATRNASGSERSSTTFLLDAISRIDNPCTALIYEMGGSMGTIAHTIELVPSLRSYDMGSSYLYSGLAVLPNVFGGPVHPSAAHGNFAMWLVENVDPVGAAAGFGFGYSFIAESYANFGTLGVPLIMLVLGAGIQGLTNWATRAASPGRYAAAASMVTFFLVFPRSESSSLIRGLVWYGLLPYLLVRFVMAFQRQNARVGAMDRGLSDVTSGTGL